MSAQRVAPMLAVAGDPPAGSSYWHEPKFDGYRVGVVVEDGQARLVSRGDRSLTAAFPTLAAAATAAAAGRSMVLDGEVVAVGAGGRPDFEALQARARRRGHGTGGPALRLVLFDLLHLDGHDLLDAPLWRRRELLEGLGLDQTPGVGLSPVFRDVDPAVLLRAVGDHALEGVVTKRVTSTYQPGRRSRAWVKTVIRHHTYVVIGGWHQGRARRAGAVGALLVGVPDPDGGGLRYVGSVETGWTRAEHAELAALLHDRVRPACPFAQPAASLPRAAVWVEPELTGRVAYREWTSTGMLRHPSWKGLHRHGSGTVGGASAPGHHHGEE